MRVTLTPLLLASLASAQLSVTEVSDTLTRARPAEVGFDVAKLEAAAAVFEAAVSKDQLRGVVLMVARQRKIVLHEAYGWRDAKGKKPMKPDSLFRMASNSKALTAIGILSLVDAGKISLDDRVAQHIPAFDTKVAREITIHQLLTHTSGMRINSLFLKPLLKKNKDNPDAPSLQAEVRRFGAIGAKVAPGTSYKYSNPGFNTLAALIEVASRTDYETYLKREFYKPLGMKDSCNHESVADHSRMSAIFRPKDGGGWRVGWQPGDDPDFPFPRGSGGMISTAYDYAIFCQMYLNGGTYGGARVLDAKLASAACQSQTSGIKGTKGYGYGWAVDPVSGVFSHSGSDGTYSWVDPRREIIGIVFTQSPRKANHRAEFRRLVTAACID